MTAQTEQKKLNLFNRVCAFIMECMMPTIPALVGTSMIKVLLVISTTFLGMDPQGSTYVILHSLADSVLFFLPVFLAYTGAKKVGGNPVLFMAIAAGLVYPELLTLMSGASLKLGTFLGMPCTYLFGLPVLTATYTSSVIPVLIMLPIMKWAEDFSSRISPNSVKSFLQPLLFCLICFPIVLFFVGPLGTLLGNALGAVISFMYDKCGWLTVGILAAIMPFTRLVGLSFALIPLCITSLTGLGYDALVIIAMFASNIAQGGSALGVAVKTKNKELRSKGIAGSISAACFGVVSPAFYEINMPLKKPIVAAVIGGFIGGVIAGLFKVVAFTMGGGSSFLSLLQFIGGDNPTRNVIFGAIAGIIALVSSFVITLLLYKEAVEEIEEEFEEEFEEENVA